MRISDWSSDVCSSDLPAAVIDRDILLAEQMRAKGDDGRGHAAAAGGDERLVKIDPGGVECGLQIVATLPRAVGVEQLAVRQAARVRNVARREAGARIALFAGEACRRARIDHLLGAAADVREHLFLGAHRSEEHPSELQSLMRISYAVFCLK